MNNPRQRLDPPRKSHVGLVMLSAFWLCSGEARAVEFKLEKGGQFELCREMAAKLKALPELLPYPFDLSFTPRDAAFQWVQWKPVEPLDHLDVIRQIAVYRNNIVAAKSPEEREARLRRETATLSEKAQAGEVSLERARFDANHDGRAETVYRVSQDIYRWPATYDPRGWTPAWNIVVMPADDPAASKHFASYAKRPLDPFYYKGRIFYWDASNPLIYEPITGRGGKDFVLLGVCQFSQKEG